MTEARRLVLILAGAGACAALLLRLLHQSPLEAFGVGLGALVTREGCATLLAKSTPLILIGLGTIVAFTARVYNIGAEGQMLVGALAATAVALQLSALPGILLIPVTLAAATLAGGLWAAVPGYLKARLGVNEVLSTVMLNQVALQLMFFLLRGPLLDPAELAAGTRIPQSATLPPQAWLMKLWPGTLLHVGLLLALALVVALQLGLHRTLLGFHLRLAGQGPRAAAYAGLRVPSYILGAMVASGALAGLAGGVELLGVHHRAYEGMTGGYGFTGIVAALLAALSPLGLVPAALLFAGVLVGADEIQRTLQVPAALALVFQGLVVLLAMAGRPAEEDR